MPRKRVGMRLPAYSAMSTRVDQGPLPDRSHIRSSDSKIQMAARLSSGSLLLPHLGL